MVKNIITRIWMSKGGAFLAAAIYSAIILLLSLLGLDFTNLPTSLNYLFFPAALFINFVPESSSLILGVPFNIVISSLAIYMAIGYVIDWIKDPFE